MSKTRLVGLITLAGFACHKNLPATPATTSSSKVLEASAQKSIEAKEAAIVLEQQDFQYSPIGKRDPFRSYLTAMAARREEEDQSRKKQPTERFEMDQYRLTGLLTGSGQPSALVEDPEGKGHTLTMGSRLGRNGGRVTRITSDKIVVVEEFRGPKGAIVKVPVDIKLRREENRR